MSDSILGSVADNIKDLGSEIIKQAVGSVGAAAKGVGTQVVGLGTEEEEAKKAADKMATHQRIAQIEAEMAAIRKQNEQKKGPEVDTSAQPQNTQGPEIPKEDKLDEASRQALGRAEQGRNFKG